MSRLSQRADSLLRFLTNDEWDEIKYEETMKHLVATKVSEPTCYERHVRDEWLKKALV